MIITLPYGPVSWIVNNNLNNRPTSLKDMLSRNNALRKKIPKVHLFGQVDNKAILRIDCPKNMYIPKPIRTEGLSLEVTK